MGYSRHPMATTLRELKLWQEAVALAGDVSRAARTAARREIKVLTDRLILAGCAIPEAVADAHGRYDPRDQQQTYRAARRALLVLETDLAIARQSELISAPVLAQLSTRTTAVGRLLSGYLAYLERQIDAADASRAALPPSSPSTSPTSDAGHPPSFAPTSLLDPDAPAAPAVFVEP